MTVKFSTDNIRTIAAFEKITKVPVKDCIVIGDCIYFLVNPRKMGMAIGKNGMFIKQLRRILDKNVKIFGYYNDPKKLIKNITPNIKNIEVGNGTITLSVAMKDRNELIGKNGANIKAIKEILNRHFGIKNVRIR